jgi:hypothetical protein
MELSHLKRDRTAAKVGHPIQLGHAHQSGARFNFDSAAMVAGMMVAAA